jgi:Diacylglycerol acyltransferase
VSAEIDLYWWWESATVQERWVDAVVLLCLSVSSSVYLIVCQSAPAGEKLVDEYHARYVEQLRALWDLYKDRFAINRTQTMRIVQ